MRYICLLRIILRCLGVNNMDNIIDIELTSRSTRRDQKLWQYDYGQVLRIAGKEFPKVAEVQFSLQQSGGHTLDRIGTSNNGLLTVQIPNELLQNKGTTSDYTIYAFVYLSGDGYGNTKYMIQLPVESRPEPTDPSEDPTIDPSIFKDAINAVNASAERAETAEKSAKESAEKAKEYAESAGKSKEDVEKARDNAISAIGIEKESALRGIEIKTVESLQKIQSQTEESQNSINQTISDATEKKKELDGAISNATDAKGNLDKAVQSAGNAKTELDTSAGNAGEVKTALDSSISSAEEKKLALDATVEQANEVDASLKEQIGSAEQIQENVEQIGKNTQAISSLNEDLEEVKDKKITKFYASNQGETHLADSDNGKIMDMMLYGRSEQKQYKGINLFPPDTNLREYVEVSIPKGSLVFWITDGTPANGGNFRFFNEDKTESMWFGIDSGTTSKRMTLTVDAKYVQNLVNDFDLSKICLGVGDKPIYEPYTGGIPSPSPDYPQEIKSVVNPTVKVTNEDGLKVQSVTLNNITLNAIPVSSDGNVTIDGQQYIADYVDVERRKLVKMVDSSKLDNTQSIVNKTEWLLAEQQEIDLTQEEVQKLKTLATYYPTTNIFISSEQLDGYTVFNYPISMANGWNYVKQQLNDNRDYIYDMDIQSAEAYVNSEYAVALTELEV
nr:MAG TPA: chromosome segregation ATPase [Caudoviricetes sp.]